MQNKQIKHFHQPLFFSFYAFDGLQTLRHSIHFATQLSGHIATYRRLDTTPPRYFATRKATVIYTPFIYK